MKYNNTVDGPRRGWSQRQAAAQDKIARAQSPMRIATSRVWQAHTFLSDAQDQAERLWRAQNDPVDSPLPGRVHPHVAQAVAAFLAERGIVDATAPMEAVTPLQMFVEVATAQARQEIAEAERDLAKLETQEAQYAALMRLGPSGLAEVLKRGVAEMGGEAADTDSE